jgi:translation initiation factor IF-3
LEEGHINQVKKRTRINFEIRVTEVRLIGADGKQVGVVPTREALQKAEEAELDLVEISPDAIPPVCRIMDYGKFIFEQNKLKTIQRKKQKQIQIKEIKLRPTTDVGDYQIKLRKMMEFLDEGDKVKISLRFKGREMLYQQLGATMMDRIEKDLVEVATIEQRPKLEGRQMIMVLGPKKK